MTLDKERLIDGADAFMKERARWGTRRNKAFSPVRYEVFRSDENGEPVVMAWSEGEEAADEERYEMCSVAAMKAALAAIGETTPQSFVKAKKERDDGWPDRDT